MDFLTEYKIRQIAKEENKNKVPPAPLSFSGVLFITFLVLKLVNVIDWKWIWVFSPLWGGVVLVFAILGIVVLISVIFSLFKKKSKNYKK